jgi:starch-binding outer membrane protein, SusD/RagB family
MKNSILKLKYSLIILAFLLAYSCNENEFLDEVPLDFYSPENSYRTMNNYEASLTDLYARVRSIHYSGNEPLNFINLLGTDIIENARREPGRFGDYQSALRPTTGVVRELWVAWYKVIANANTILSRMAESELTEQQKLQVEGEARFFRAFAYRNLVYLYGGVPLILDEITAPKNDFTRASRTEVLNQIADDFSFAGIHLPTIDKVTDGKLSNIVAKHYLAETLISLGNFDQAITEATAVINDPNTSLMTSRFGTRANENPFDKLLKFTKPGDVFWDLFQVGNQNRKAGNKEALWVIQMELDVPGGYLSSTSGNVARYERDMNPAAWLLLLDPDGKQGMLNVPMSDYNGGGRGVSFNRTNQYFLYDLWNSDFENDIRNAPHNIVRDIVYNNPASAYYGQSAILPDGTLNSPTWKNQNWRWYPYPTKTTTPGNHPDELFDDKERGILKSGAGTTYRDQYMLRLAETYLLRAEAYLGKSDLANAAADINTVRTRAKASSIASSEATIDYILDERARELVYEEQRRITLARLGKLVERVREYNTLNRNNIGDHHALFPIPFSEIEANKNAVIEQNPGYN